MRGIVAEDECNDTYGRCRMYQALNVVVKHFCNISFEKFTMYVLLQMASSNHYTNGDGYDYTIRTHIS